MFLLALFGSGIELKGDRQHIIEDKRVVLVVDDQKLDILTIAVVFEQIVLKETVEEQQKVSNDLNEISLTSTKLTLMRIRLQSPRLIRMSM